MKMRELESTTSHTNTFSQVLTELSLQGLNFEEEIEALALHSSLLTRWEVFCTTITNNLTKLTLDEAIEAVLSEDLRRKSMGLTIDDSTKAHFSTRMAQRTGRYHNRHRRSREAGHQMPINYPTTDNNIHVAESWSGEILSLEESSTGEVLYNAQDVHTWLLDSGITFHVTLNIELKGWSRCL